MHAFVHATHTCLGQACPRLPGTKACWLWILILQSTGCKMHSSHSCSIHGFCCGGSQSHPATWPGRSGLVDWGSADAGQGSESQCTHSIQAWSFKQLHASWPIGLARSLYLLQLLHLLLTIRHVTVCQYYMQCSHPGSTCTHMHAWAHSTVSNAAKFRFDETIMYHLLATEYSHVHLKLSDSA